MTEAISLIKRGVSEIIQEDELYEQLSSGVTLRIKAGFDPTAPDLHLGHTVLLNKLRHFQDLGHRVFFVIGDFTAQIGDPSGKNVTRPMLTSEEVLENTKTYAEQVFKVLDREKTSVVFNSSWTNTLTPADFIKLTGQYTVARMLEREDFKQRFQHNTAISIHEFMYPLLQGYDSVALQADVELGGTDQKFNLLMGRTLQVAYGQKPQSVITMPLLEGLDGEKKMSKSLGNYIGITDSPSSMFGKILSISDTLMWRYYELLSLKSESDIEQLKKNVEQGIMHPKVAKEELAKEIVARFHSLDAAQKAQQEFNAIFSQRAMPETMDEFTVQYGDASKPVEFLLFSGTVSSKGEARRLIAQNALTVDGEKVCDPLAPLIPGEYNVKLGKRRFFRLIVTENTQK